jgi:hypothetical protein
LYSRSYLENQMAVALGGRCGLYGKSVSFRHPLIAAGVQGAELVELSYCAGLLKR